MSTTEIYIVLENTDDKHSYRRVSKDLPSLEAAESFINTMHDGFLYKDDPMHIVKYISTVYPDSVERRVL